MCRYFKELYDAKCEMQNAILGMKVRMYICACDWLADMNENTKYERMYLCAI